MPMSDSYKLAMEDAKRELMDINKLLEDLQPRRDRLIGLIRMLEPMVKRTAETKAANPEAVNVNLFENTDPLWKQIARAMKDKGPFTMAAAGRDVEKMTGQSLEPNRPQKIRNAMIRHADVFQRNEDGTYTVTMEG